MEMSVYIIPGLETRRPIDAVNVEFMVCNALGIDPVMMQEMKKCRKRELVEARDIIFFILVKQFGWGLTKTGKFYSKNHATVIHGIKTVSNLMEVDKDFREKVKGLIEV